MLLGLASNATPMTRCVCGILGGVVTHVLEEEGRGLVAASPRSDGVCVRDDCRPKIFR